MNPAFWAIVLLAIGLVLFFAEIFIPSGGMILASALVCVFLSIWSAYSAWWTGNPALFLSFVAVAFILIPLSVGAAISMWPKTPLGRRAEPPRLDEVTPYLEEQRHLEQLLGKTGTTETPLNPGGIVRIRDERIHCRSEGLIVPKGSLVSVIGISGNGLIVRSVPTESPENSVKSGVSLEKNGKSTSNRLDFELPES